MTAIASWTAGRARRVDQLAGPGGVIVGVAVDHRDSMAIALRRRGLPAPTPQELTALKLRVASVLAPAASVLLLDAEYAAAQALAAGVVPRDTALVVPLEAQGYGDDNNSRRTSFLPGWTPQKAAALGAAGCKLLLPYRPDLPEQHEPQDAVARVAIEQCRAAGVAMVLEPIVYARAGEELDLPRFAQLVIETAAALAALRPEILKVQYPGSEIACEELDSACGREVPWVLLGGGGAPDSFERQIESACRAGASGFIVGRTLFEPALVSDPRESDATLRQQSLPTLEGFATTAQRYARPWRDRIGEIPWPADRWWED